MDAVQSRILEIYKEIKKICDRHNITYFAIGGTCIGAVRHKGFIPWDDDIDIAIPVEEYNSFLEICGKELPEYLNVYTPEENAHYFNVFCKIIDKRTTFIADTIKQYPDSYYGLFVDVMPMSGVPSGSFKRNFWISRLRRLRTLNGFKRRTINDYSSKRIKKVYRFVSVFIKRRPQNWFLQRYKKLIWKYPLKTAEYVGYSWSSRLKQLVFKQDLFSKTVDMPFEDTTIKCPCGFHEYLTQMFGNYMEYPPDNERKSGHSGFVDLQKSYIYYQELYEAQGDNSQE